MNEAERNISTKYYLLNFCALSEHERKKLIYEIKHFEKRLDKKGKKLECCFTGYSSPYYFTVTISNK